MPLLHQLESIRKIPKWVQSHTAKFQQPILQRDSKEEPNKQHHGPWSGNNEEPDRGNPVGDGVTKGWNEANSPPRREGCIPRIHSEYPSKVNKLEDGQQSANNKLDKLVDLISRSLLQPEDSNVEMENPEAAALIQAAPVKVTKSQNQQNQKRLASGSTLSLNKAFKIITLNYYYYTVQLKKPHIIKPYYVQSLPPPAQAPDSSPFWDLLEKIILS